MRRLIIVVLILVVLLPRQLITAQPPDSDAPYLYYYSERLNAFVIERADGTDSRLFGQDTLDPETYYVTGPGWSPSGEWFAVNADNRWNPERKQSSMILNVNGEDRITLLDNIDINWMDWAPEDDILVASTFTWDEARRVTQVVYFLLDVNDNKLLREFRLETELPDNHELKWMSNEAQFVISYTNPVTQGDSFIISTIHGDFTKADLPAKYYFPNGAKSVSATGWILWEGLVLNLLSFDMFMLPEGHEYSDPYWTNDGQRGAFYCGNDRVCRLDVEKATIEELDIEYESYGLRNVPFSQDGRYILIYEHLDRLSIYDIDSATSYVPSYSFQTSFPQTADRGPYNFTVYHGWDYTTDMRELHVEHGIDEQIIFTQFRPPSVAYYSHDEQYIGLVHYGAVIREVSTQEETIFLPSSRGYYHGGSPAGQIIWHPERNWFISTEGFFVAGGGSSTVMIVTGDAETGLRRQLFECPELNSVCIGWLPQTVDVDDLPAPSLEEVFPLPKPVQILDAQNWVNYLRWSVDGEYLQFGDYYPFNNVVQIADWTYVLDVDDIEFQPERSYLGGQSFDEGLSIVHRNGRYSVIRTGTGEVVFDIPALMVHYEVSPDGKWLVGGAISGDIEIWSLESGTMVNSLPVSGSPIAFSPDGTKLAAGVSWEVWIWDVEDLVGE
jgi:WD40 repeat protein